QERGRFWRENWYELPGLVPLYAESFSLLRAARLLRIIRVLRLLRAVHAVHRLRRAVRFVDRVFRESHLGVTLGVAGFIVAVMASGFWILERGSNEQLKGFDDALWWAIST